MFENAGGASMLTIVIVTGHGEAWRADRRSMVGDGSVQGVDGDDSDDGGARGRGK